MSKHITYKGHCGTAHAKMVKLHACLVCKFCTTLQSITLPITKQPLSQSPVNSLQPAEWLALLPTEQTAVSRMTGPTAYWSLRPAE